MKILPTGVNGIVPPEGSVVALLARVGGLARLLLLGLGGLLGLGLGVLLVTSGIFILFDRRGRVFLVRRFNLLLVSLKINGGLEKNCLESEKTHGNMNI